MLIVLFLFLWLQLSSATHITVLLSGGTHAKNPQEYKDALKYAFNRYILPQDIISAYTFQGKRLLSGVPCNEREKIFTAIDHLEIDLKCSDWHQALSNIDLSSPSRVLYMITDENPCSRDPTPVARQLEKEGFQINVIGIGKAVDKAWLKRVVSLDGVYKWLESFHYTTSSSAKRKRYTGRSVESPISTGEIVVASIVGALILIIIVISCVFACRPRGRSWK